MKPSKRELAAIGTWIIVGETGMSSKALCGVFLGAPTKTLSHPHDPGDFRRCYNFLTTCVYPSKRTKLLAVMAERDGRWQAIAEHWDEMARLHKRERRKECAPELYQLMKDIGL